MALTDTSIKRLKPKARSYLVSDGQGLGLEILPSGSRSWRYRYRLNGKLEKVSLGHYRAFNLQAARKKRDEYAEIWRTESRRARHKQAEKYAMAHTTTVFELGERYFNGIVQRDCKDPRPIRRYLDNEIYPRLADKAVRDVMDPGRGSGDRLPQAGWWRTLLNRTDP